MNEINVWAESGQVFDYTGGYLCLDFVNTLAGRMDRSPREHLCSYRDLVSWGRQGQVIADDKARLLLEKAAQDTDRAEMVIAGAIKLREALFRIMMRVAQGARPDLPDLAILNETLSQGMGQAGVMLENDDFNWGWSTPELEYVGWAVARSAAELLTSELRHEVRECAADDCGWLFLDTSKNHSRRWCDMKTCGNRAKARRYVGRKK